MKVNNFQAFVTCIIFYLLVLCLLKYLPVCWFCYKAQFMSSNPIFGYRPQWHSDLELIWRIRRLFDVRHYEIQGWCNIEFCYSEKKSTSNIKQTFLSSEYCFSILHYIFFHFFHLNKKAALKIHIRYVS